MSAYTRTFLLGSFLVLGLAACSGKSTVWDNEQASRQNQVELLRLPYDIRFAGDMTTLTTQERARLDSFLASVKPGAQDVIALDQPDSANSRLASAREIAVRDHLAKAGYTVAEGTSPVGEAPAANSLRLVIERAVVRTPRCPDWSRKAAPNYENAPTSNMGCANETALGLMVANPRDLVTPQTYEPADAESAAKAIDALHQGKVKWPEVKQGVAFGGGN